MRQIKVVFILLTIVIGGYLLFHINDTSPAEAIHDVNNVFTKKKSIVESKSVPEKKLPEISLKGELFHWIGKTSEQLTKQFGDPIRIDPSAYGYKWWVYTDQTKQYVQFGIEEGEVKTIFATGNDLSTVPIQIGKSYEEIKKQFPFEKNVSYNEGLSSYTFQLTEEDVRMRPLIKVADNIFVQCYFDTITNRLSSIRILTADILLKQRPYAIEYRGNLPKQPDLSDEEWKKVEKGMEQQIFDITNVMRYQFEKEKLKWNETVSEVAFLHSKDMAKHNYFSHYSQNGDGLKERLAAKEVYYFSAGENIAAQYPDAPAAMEGWLNSKGHRDALLKDDYTQLGVGVYHFYYTQNFVEKP